MAPFIASLISSSCLRAPAITMKALASNSERRISYDSDGLSVDYGPAAACCAWEYFASICLDGKCRPCIFPLRRQPVFCSLCCDSVRLCSSFGARPTRSLAPRPDCQFLPAYILAPLTEDCLLSLLFSFALLCVFLLDVFPALRGLFRVFGCVGFRALAVVRQ
eukprot:m.899761 g.899761  ORF g.899761 m.899761 type:complete len:163 (-) comp60034_c0_seq21:27-515(-)